MLCLWFWFYSHPANSLKIESWECQFEFECSRVSGCLYAHGLYIFSSKSSDRLQDPHSLSLQAQTCTHKHVTVVDWTTAVQGRGLENSQKIALYTSMSIFTFNRKYFFSHLLWLRIDQITLCGVGFLGSKDQGLSSKPEVTTLAHTPLPLLLLTYFCCPSVSPSFKVAL